MLKLGNDSSLILLKQNVVIASDCHPLKILRFLAVKFMPTIVVSVKCWNCLKQVNGNTEEQMCGHGDSFYHILYSHRIK